MKKSTKVLAGTAALIVGVGVLTASTVSAHGFGDRDGTLITRFAEAFGKSEDEVRAVFEEIRTEKRAEAQEHFEARLQEAVDNGELTAEKQALILQKHAELMAEREASRESGQDLSQEERQAEREARRAELEAWAEENGIDLSWFRGGGDHQGSRHGGRKGFGKGEQQ